MAALVALFLVLGALGVALLPLLGEEPARAEPDALGELLTERDELVGALREADLDLAMGKITTEDHAELHRSLEDRAVVVLARIDRERVRPEG